MISDSSVFVCRLRVRIGAVRASNRGEELMLMKRFMALLLAMFMWGQAVAEEPMKTLHVQGDDAFWRAHPEIPHEEAWYAAETDALTMLLETQADAVMLALYNDELQPLLAAEALDTVLEEAYRRQEPAFLALAAPPFSLWITRTRLSRAA